MPGVRRAGRGVAGGVGGRRREEAAPEGRDGEKRLRPARNEEPRTKSQEHSPSTIHPLPPDHAQLAHVPTEQPNPRSANLETRSTRELVELFISEEENVTRALAECREEIIAAVDLVSSAMVAGGRLFYIGAGTSGRLGVLDASEIPPTFGAPPELVQGIIAGGAVALHRAVEGAEDQAEAGALAILERGVRAGDVVCGLTASGRTPFVLGALARAREMEARTILVCCNRARAGEPETVGTALRAVRPASAPVTPSTTLSLSTPGAPPRRRRPRVRSSRKGRGWPRAWGRSRQRIGHLREVGER